ncbi:MAG TPA: NUDIX hydrolase [Verrucomicrobiae bacterium]|jgi:ADP-ribose pyrophosphatase|nr:NUDIX hydrolase [Verrucomicrobiae bacterium]
MIQPWKKISSNASTHYPIFSIRTDRKVSPRTGQEHDFFVIDCVDWVNVVATTPDNHIVMIEQFRHGTNSVELEIPGGMIDPRDASPGAAGERELREETGYEGEQPRIIGQVSPNPAIMSNTCFTLHVQNCRLKHPVDWDHGEDLITRLIPIADIPGLIAAGKIRHSLVIVGLYYFQLNAARPGK